MSDAQVFPPREGVQAPRRRGSRTPSRRAPIAATAAWAERRKLASSKFARRLAVPRTSRRVRLFFPLEHRVVRAETCKQCRDRVAVTNDDAIHSPHFARLRGDARACVAAPTSAKRGLGSRRGDLEARGTARLGERAVREKSPTPCGDGVLDEPPTT